MNQQTKIETLLSSLEQAADNYDEMNVEAEYSIGDVVTFEQDGVKYVGVIEDEDKNGCSIRVYAQAGSKFEPTDDVVFKTTGELSAYDLEEQNTPGDTVKWVGRDGANYVGVVTGLSDEQTTVEAYFKMPDGKFAPSGQSVQAKPEAFTPTLFNRKSEERKLLVKMSDLNMEIGEANVGTLKGYASTYGNVDLGGDTVEKGAYTQTLRHKKGKVKLLFDHGWRVKDLAGVAFLEDKEQGLWMEAKMPLDAQDVRDNFTKVKFLIDNGIDVGLSIGYDAVKSTYNNDGVRALKEIALHEITVTPWPMDTEAQILEAKARRIQFAAKSAKITPADAPIGSQPDQDASALDLFLQTFKS